MTRPAGHYPFEPQPDDWKDQAACAGVPLSMFYLDDDEQGSTGRWRKAARLCFTCPVLAECRAFVDATEGNKSRAYGFWAGETAKQRIARRKAVAVDAA